MALFVGGTRLFNRSGQPAALREVALPPRQHAELSSKTRGPCPAVARWSTLSVAIGAWAAPAWSASRAPTGELVEQPLEEPDRRPSRWKSSPFVSAAPS